MQKIMFNDKYGLTTAVLEGRKTMTRRTICSRIWEKYSEYEMGFCVKGLENIFGALEDSQEYLIGLPPYKVGEVIAIAQSYDDIYMGKNAPCLIAENYRLNAYRKGFLKNHKGWENKMFVSGDDMPHHIKITDIKVERLQDISNEDCLREGIQRIESPNGYTYIAGGIKMSEEDLEKIKNGKIKLSKTNCFNTPREAFAALIDKVGKRGDWNNNPWVFAYSFELVD